MHAIKAVWDTTWRSVLVALGYVLGIILAGMLAAMLGWEISSGPADQRAMALLFASVFLLGVFLGPLASRIRLSRAQHFILWGSVIIFNLGAVALEGAYFAPSLVGLPVHVLLTQQLLAALAASLVITLLFSRAAPSVSWRDALRTRPWHSWVWRFLASAFSYLVFYFVFGGLNYSLATKPYYETHAGGLAVPTPQVVLILESIRGILIVFSVLLFLLSMRGKRTRLMLMTGWILFAIGGIIPLIWQVGNLPLFLLFASAIEIFFQNFLTGAVAAWLLGTPEPAPA